MNTTVGFRKAATFNLVLGLALLAVPALWSQTAADEAVAKKYANILGRYDLDLTALGGDMHPTNVIVKEGGLWLDDGDGRPSAIKPIGDSGLEFEGQDDNGRALKVSFIKDESGSVVKMHLVMPDAEMDVFGKKIK